MQRVKPWAYLLTLGDRVELCLELLRDSADLPRPLLAVIGGGVSTCYFYALLFMDGLAVWHIVLHHMRVILGPALADVLSPANLGPGQVAVLKTMVGY